MLHRLQSALCFRVILSTISWIHVTDTHIHVKILTETWMTDLINAWIRTGIEKMCVYIFFVLPVRSWLRPISMKTQIHSPHMETEPLSLQCYDSASRCRYEPPLSDGDKVYKWQPEFRKSFLTLIESRFSRVNSLHVGEREQWTRCLIPAENCLSAFSYLSSKKQLPALALYLLSSHHTHLFV